MERKADQIGNSLEEITNRYSRSFRRKEIEEKQKCRPTVSEAHRTVVMQALLIPSELDHHRDRF